MSFITTFCKIKLPLPSLPIPKLFVINLPKLPIFKLGLDVQLPGLPKIPLPIPKIPSLLPPFPKIPIFTLGLDVKLPGMPKIPSISIPIPKLFVINLPKLPFFRFVCPLD